MIAMNTTAALLVNAEPLSRGNGKGADVVNNVKTANPIIAHKPVSLNYCQQVMKLDHE